MIKTKKLINGVFGVLAFVYIIIMVFPQFLFANNFHYKNFSVYYHSDEISIETLKSVLDQSESLLEKTSLFHNEHQEIYMCNSFAEFAFFAPLSRDAFAVNHPLTQNIFLSESSVSNNQIIRNAETNRKRSLSGVIAHETTHSILENRLGLFTYKRLPSWKNEGYCDYVAKESSSNEEQAWLAVCDDQNNPEEPSFLYFKYRMFVQYLLENNNTELDHFFSKDYDLDLLDKKLKIISCQ